MSQENVETVRAIYEQLAHGDASSSSRTWATGQG
jgi:hypothetical protein